MSTRLFLLLSLIFSLLQGALLPSILAEGVLVLLFVLARLDSARLANQSARVFIGLLVSGLIFDLVQGDTLGVSSLIFVAVGTLMTFLKKDIPFSTPWVGAAVSILILLARSKIIFDTVDWPAILVCGTLTFFVLAVVRVGRPERLEIQ